jgi:3-dehydroquinate synthase
MLMVNEEKDELEKYLKLLNISYDFDIEEEKLKEIILQDKKINGDYIDLIMVDKISEGYIKKTSLNELDNILKGGISYVRHFRK